MSQRPAVVYQSYLSWDMCGNEIAPHIKLAGEKLDAIPKPIQQLFVILQE